MRFFVGNLLPYLLIVPVLVFGSEELRLARQAADDQLLDRARGAYTKALESAESAEDRHQALLELALTQIQMGNVSEALTLLEELPRRMSADQKGQALVLHADILQSRREAEEALDKLSDIKSLPSSWEELRIGVKAKCLLQTEGTVSALAFVEEHASVLSQERVQLERAEILKYSGRKEEAIEGYRELVRDTTSVDISTQARIHLSALLLEEDRAAEVLDILQPLLEQGTNSIRLEFSLYPLVIEAYEKEQQPLVAAEMIGAFAQRIEDQDVRISLFAREARNRIMGGELLEMEQQLAKWIAQFGEAPALMSAQAMLASAWMDQGELEKASLAYQRYLSVVTDPKNRLQAETGFADTLVQLGKYDEAIPILSRTRKQFPKDASEQASLLFLQADAELRRGNAEAASTLFTTWLNEYTDHEERPSVLLRSSVAYAEAGQLSKALLVLDEIRTLVPGSDIAEKALLQRAVVLGPQRVEQALGAFDAYLEAYPEGAFVADAMTEKGIAAYRLGLFDLAIREFSNVEEQFPDHDRAEQAFCLRGWAHYLKGEDDEAEQIGTSFLQTYPESTFEPEVRVWLAEMAYNRGDFQKAADEFVILAGEKYATPTRTRAAYLAGRSLLANEEVGLALPWFKTSLELNPNSVFAPDVLFYMGDTLTELDRFDEAIVQFDKVIREYPESYLVEPALGRIGDCQYTLGEENPGRYIEALNTYRQVKESARAPLELQLQATYKVGRVFAALQRIDEALDAYLETATRYKANATRLPASASIWFVRSVTDAAQYYESTNEYREAIKIYRLLSSTQLDGASEAARRIEDLRRQHLILF